MEIQLTAGNCKVTLREGRSTSCLERNMLSPGSAPRVRPQEGSGIKALRISAPSLRKCMSSSSTRLSIMGRGMSRTCAALDGV
ncbi:hypothetical protein AVEN_112257-1 [Araneus ventricosus]|uniref:Uncharacterized protein n=1 Tax=Araneus ventricosus TaxID=182803 RepID=A0A4Y2U078_ARAVE|nr:hypothetical protein AVEN_112257-1 [Araneus ventricosus]